MDNMMGILISIPQIIFYGFFETILLIFEIELCFYFSFLIFHMF